MSRVYWIFNFKISTCERWLILKEHFRSVVGEQHFGGGGDRNSRDSEKSEDIVTVNLATFFLIDLQTG